MEKRSLNRILILLHLANLALLAALLVFGLPTQYILLAMLGTTLGLIVFSIGSISRYLRQISRIAQQVSQGDSRVRIPELDLEEFDSMGRSINQMLGRLDHTIGHLALHREELRLLLGSIEDALWSQDAQGRIVWANDAFARLFPGYLADAKQRYWELIRDPELAGFISKAGAGRLIREFQLEEHYYLLLGTRNPEADRTVFILQNIDPIRQAQQMKKDFIVNLAHELRTPLTAIKGFSEALEPGSEGERLRWLKIIQNHSQRLINLVEDLESLIRLERRADLKTQDIDLKTFFDNLSLILEPLLAEQGLSLEISLGEGVRRATLDPFSFEQIFINLVENSIRYTRSGGVSISVERKNADLLFKICDTGSGIGEKHLSRIFERFYVGEPSRNRAKSGTGLGLSIVKHIVLLHKGSISVQSELGQGTCFLITIPI